MNARAKVLKPFTIIPESLYVERAADRQLQTIIGDMGRPGYVLVARQMGKTNLLLHARRRLERPEDAFAYQDFSLPAEFLRDQLRGITDAVISAKPLLFASLKEAIKRARNEDKLPAHKEHENELRALLETTSGKIVLIFDEIDALINTTYSDQLFSLVRSIYFSRTNFPEFSRLTYVLSGVAEPSELIKNKNISPFNIGEKIYLDDFTLDEVQIFLKKANIGLSESALQRLYFWTQGNPRMTWDVCAALEEVIATEGQVEAWRVDTEVEKLYFGSMDRAPVDHIRTIVGDQRDIRAAIRQIRTGQGNIGDQMRAKLYLAGIIGSAFDSGDPKLKNRVVELALSDSWLDDVERRKRNALELAQERFKNRQFKEALALYTEHLSGLAEQEDKSILYYEIGYCHFEEERYEEAKKWFERKPIDRQAALVLYLHEVYLLGLCNTYLNKYQEAIAAFQTVIDAGRKDGFYFQALVNQAAARVLAGGDQNLILAGDALREVLSGENELRVNMPEEEARKIQISARVNLGRVLEAGSKFDDAIGEFEIALDQAMAHEKATLLTSLIGLEREPSRIAERVSEAMAFVTAYKPMLAQRTATNPLAFDYPSMVVLYGHVAMLEDLEKRRQFSDYVRKNYFTDIGGDTRFTFDVATTAFAKGNSDLVRSELSEFLTRAKGNTSDGIRALALKLILVRNRRPDAALFRSQFFQLLERKTYPQLDLYDLQIIIDYISDLVSGGRYAEALRIIELAKSYRAATAPDLSRNYAVIDYFEMTLSFQIGNIERVRELAAQLKDLGDATAAQAPHMLFTAEDTKTIRAQAADLLNTAVRQIPVRNPHADIGRNEQVIVRYKDGRTVRAKFKKLKRDIDAGECTVVGKGSSTVTQQ